MNPPIKVIDLEQFALLVANYPLQRSIDSVHLHHTLRPNHAQWRGQATVEAMRRVHMQERGFRDIAQHLTIDPLGGLWTGRDWNLPPASSRGRDDKGRAWNGDSARGPFMIELVGDFDLGRDPWLTHQRQALIEVLALLMARAPEGSLDVVPHLVMDKTKSCPGTSLVSLQAIENDLPCEFTDLVEAARTRARALPQAEQLRALPPMLRDWLHSTTGSRSEPLPAYSENFEQHHEVPEDHAAFASIEHNARELSGVSRGARGAINPDYVRLNGHVVNTVRGRLSEHTGPRRGLFFTSQEELGGTFFTALDVFEKDLDDAAPLRLMLHAHGGLVSESTALKYALEHMPWWRDALQVFPFYMVWETGGLETLLGRKRAFTGGERGLGDWLIEKTAGPLGFKLWRSMKHNAELSASSDWSHDFKRLTGKPASPPAGAGVQGGGRQFAAALAARLARIAERREVQVHALGHSAGSIYHAHFLPVLVAEMRKRAPWNDGRAAIHSLHLLAPAIRIDDFERRLAPLAGTDIARLHLYTMDDRRERDDTVAWVYRKSLLYFVDEACENDNPGILGMQTYLQQAQSVASSPISKVFPLGGSLPGEVIYSDGGATEQRSTSVTHGGFDNDSATMASVARSVLRDGSRHLSFLPSQGHRLWCGESAVVDPLRAVFETEEESQADPSRAAETQPQAAGVSASSGRFALCIGVDNYPGNAALHGCVNDARAWSQALQALGFAVTRLENSQASLEGVRQALRTHLEGAASGDWLVLQFAGHGTQFPNTDGSEAFDQAYVPQDFRSSGCLIDNELYALLMPHAQRLNISVFFDTCHSGSASRLAPLGLDASDGSRRARYLAADEQMLALQRRTPSRSLGLGGQRSNLGVPWLHLGACQDHEYAYETNGSGDFTRAAVPLLARAAAEAWQGHQLLTEILRNFPANARQTPQLMASIHAGRVALPATNRQIAPRPVRDESLQAALAMMEEGLRAWRRSLDSHA